MGKDITTFLNEVWIGKHNMMDLNFTYVTLIAKIDNPSRIKDFRPISLYNGLYKIFSKAIVFRMKNSLNLLVSFNQSAFIPGRLITDNILIAKELFHSMKHKTSNRGSMAVKLDMAKAYDRVEWLFVHNLFIRMGFDTVWVSRIMRCIFAVTFSFLVNGNPSQVVVPSRGLRQGDPLSPYIFILITEGLFRTIHQRMMEG